MAERSKRWWQSSGGVSHKRVAEQCGALGLVGGESCREEVAEQW